MGSHAYRHLIESAGLLGEAVLLLLGEGGGFGGGGRALAIAGLGEVRVEALSALEHALVAVRHAITAAPVVFFRRGVCTGMGKSVYLLRLGGWTFGVLGVTTCVWGVCGCV